MSTGPQGANVVPLKPDTKANAKRVDRALLARLPAPVHAVQLKGKQVIAGLLRTLFDKADDSLFELADRAVNNQDQNLFFESMREVRLKRRAVETHFADHIDAAFARLASPEAQAEVQDDAYASDLDIDSLSLVQNDELEELVATDSMIQKANERFAEPIQHLAIRIDSLVPVKVYQKNNPLGPDTLCEGFVDATGCMSLDIKARLVLFKLFDRLVVTQLGKLYEEVNKTLIEHNVLPSLKGQLRQRRQGPAGVRAPGGSVAGGSGPQAGAGASLGGGSADEGEVLSTLQQLLAQQRGESGVAGDQLNPEFTGDTIGTNDVMRLLSQLQQRDLPSGQRNIKSVLDHVLRARDDGKKLGQLDDDIINLVNMMFEFILDDRNLAPPMKALLGRLQIPLLKVAIADKTFFSKGGHPARRLLNELATAALGWQGDGGEKDALYKKIDGIVQKLITDFESDVSIFSDMLADFVSFIEKEKRRASILEQRTLDAEDGKAKAERARALVNQSVATLIGDRTMPAPVLKLLQEAWGNVLFLICLKHDTSSDEWKEALQTAADLVWSVSATLDKEARARMLQLVPDLLKRLRTGLESVSYNPFEMTQLFKQLQAVHLQRLKAPLEAAAAKVAAQPQPAAKPEAAAKAQPAKAQATPAAGTPAAGMPAAGMPAAGMPAAGMPAAGMPAAGTQAQAPKAPEPNLAEPNLAEPRPAEPSPQAMVETVIAALPEEVPAAPAAPAQDDNPYLAQVARMSPGSWFEHHEDGQQYRCRLAAIIKATGKYIFVNRAGMKVAEKTAVEFAQALRDGKLQSLDDGMLFDRALEAVIGNLRSTRGR
ncbi:DUF1631 domain-containing protein [Simiduia sp. 21SJ11W-1]|uniref:DUF1631 domain-containing protein n=1 Tax=Simiduia sp. 21SJ11W-1 TaxID=2909669 RepID=UPI0020A03104|nr:DUF1631 domain-containing protein [Simiduia sp. 21SJ11W-1]UTA48890.1 DUF1631 domain-containing protein [Simiduia sp. 21SJ11W-1]